MAAASLFKRGLFLILLIHMCLMEIVAVWLGCAVPFNSYSLTLKQLELMMQILIGCFNSPPFQFGEVDIDGSLVASHASASEEIIMVNNGCLCCTVRGDLVKMLLELVKKKRDKFDHIVIETTGNSRLHINCILSNGQLLPLLNFVFAHLIFERAAFIYAIFVCYQLILWSRYYDYNAFKPNFFYHLCVNYEILLQALLSQVQLLTHFVLMNWFQDM